MTTDDRTAEAVGMRNAPPEAGRPDGGPTLGVEKRMPLYPQTGECLASADPPRRKLAPPLRHRFGDQRLFLGRQDGGIGITDRLDAQAHAGIEEVLHRSQCVARTAV